MGRKRDAGGWQGTNTKIWGSKDGSGSKEFDWIGLDFLRTIRAHRKGGCKGFGTGL